MSCNSLGTGAEMHPFAADESFHDSRHVGRSKENIDSSIESYILVERSHDPVFQSNRRYSILNSKVSNLESTELLSRVEAVGCERVYRPVELLSPIRSNSRSEIRQLEQTSRKGEYGVQNSKEIIVILKKTPSRAKEFAQELRSNPKLMTKLHEEIPNFMIYVAELFKDYPEAILNQVAFFPEIIAVFNAGLTKSFYLDAIEKNEKCYLYIPEELRTNKPFILEAIDSNPKVFTVLPVEMKSTEFLIEILKITGKCFQYFDLKDRDTNTLVEFAVKKDSSNFRFASDRLKGDVVFIRSLVKGFPEIIKEASDTIRKDIKTAEYFVRINYKVFPYFDSSIIEDESNINRIIEVEGLCIRYLLKSRFLSPQLAETAIFQNSSAMTFLVDTNVLSQVHVDSVLFCQPTLITSFPDVHKTDHNFSVALKKDGLLLGRASSKQRKSKKLVEIAVKQNPLALQFVSFDVRTDSLVLTAVKLNGEMIQYALPNQKENPDIIVAAILQTPAALKFVDPDALTHPKILKLFRKNGNLLQYSTPEQKRKDLVVDSALRNTPHALKYLSHFMITDERVKAAVSKDGTALQHARKIQKENLEIAEIAIRENPLALKFVPKEVMTRIFALLAVSLRPCSLEFLPNNLRSDSEIVSKAFICSRETIQFAIFPLTQANHTPFFIPEIFFQNSFGTQEEFLEEFQLVFGKSKFCAIL
jgi:hypothetical protein